MIEFAIWVIMTQLTGFQVGPPEEPISDPNTKTVEAPRMVPSLPPELNLELVPTTELPDTKALIGKPGGPRMVDFSYSGYGEPGFPRTIGHPQLVKIFTKFFGPPVQLERRSSPTETVWLFRQKGRQRGVALIVKSEDLVEILAWKLNSKERSSRLGTLLESDFLRWLYAGIALSSSSAR